MMENKKFEFHLESLEQIPTSMELRIQIASVQFDVILSYMCFIQ